MNFGPLKKIFLESCILFESTRVSVRPKASHYCFGWRRHSTRGHSVFVPSPIVNSFSVKAYVGDEKTLLAFNFQSAPIDYKRCCADRLYAGVKRTSV